MGVGGRMTCIKCGKATNRRVRRELAQRLPREIRREHDQFPYCLECGEVAVIRVWNGLPIQIPDEWRAAPPQD